MAATNSYPTLTDALNLFTNGFTEKKQVTSAINCFLLTSFGFSKKSPKMTEQEAKSAKNLGKTIRLDLFTKQELLNKIEAQFGKLNLTNNQKKAPRSNCRKFLNYLEENNYLKPEKVLVVNQKEEPLFFDDKSIRLVDKSHLECQPKRKHSSKVKLSYDPQVYLNDYLNLNDTEKIDKINRELDRLKADLELYRKYEIDVKGNSRHTANLNCTKILTILGWLYYYHGIKLESLSLTSLVQVVNTYDAASSQKQDNIKNIVSENLQAHFETEPILEVDELDDLDLITSAKYRDYLRELVIKDRLEKRQTKAAENTYALLEAFINERKISPQNVHFYTSAVSSLARYLYKDSTNTSIDKSHEDIKVIKYLKLLKKQKSERRKKEIKLPYEWKEIIKIRDLVLKVKADRLHYRCKNPNSKFYRARRKSAVANDLQKFIIICMFTLNPPDRSRTIRELELGRTLKYGHFSNGGVFTKAENLLAPSQAQYYFHLQEGDYKTWKAYGDYYAPINNHVFDDGTTFYQYLDKWFNEGYRDSLREDKTCEKCFFMPQKHIPFPSVKLDKQGNFLFETSPFSNYIRRIFEQGAGLGMNAHRLRHTFVSWMKEEDSFSTNQLEDIANAMHHSSKMQQSVYTVRDKLKIVQNANKVMETAN